MMDPLLQLLRRTAIRLGGMDMVVLSATLVLVGALFAFVEIAGEVVEGDTQSFDERVLLSLRHQDDLAEPIGPRWLEDVARDLTALGGITTLVLITLIVVGYLLMSGTMHAMWLVLGATTGGLILSSTLKLFFDRPRPSVVPHLAHVSTASFPSGHSMLSAVVYLTLGSLLARLSPKLAVRVYVLSVAIMLAFLIGLSRIYLGVHYPTDVLAGWMVGLAWSMMCWHVARYLQRRGKVERVVEPTSESS